MSDMTPEMEEFLARIRRMNYETEKFIAEHDKLAAEARKFDRERAIAPWQLAILTIGSVLGGVGGLLAIIRAGVGHP